MDKKINIGLFIDTFFPMVDGVVMVVDNYAKIMGEYANVTVFCPKPKKKDYKDNFNYNVVRCKKINFFNFDYNLGIPKFDRKFKKALKEANLDIVHIHSPFNVAKAGVKYAKKHNLPLIATLHSQFKRDFYRATKIKWLTNLLLKKVMKVFNKCDECWAVNAEIKKLYIEEYKLKAPCKVQNNGTDIALVENKPQADALINKMYNLDADDKVFLFVGRINKLKNVLFIAESLKYVKESGLKFKMMYVGAGPDEEELKEKVKKLGLEEQVIMPGKVLDRDVMRKIYNRADLFLFPSLYDASSLVQIEAASQKTPTIFIRNSATAGTVTEDVNGFMTEHDTKEYANKIVKAMTDEKYYKTVSEGAYRDLFVSWNDAVNKAYKDYFVIKDNKK